MNRNLLNLYRRSTGYLSRVLFHLTDRQLGRLAPGTYLTKYPVDQFKRTDSLENPALDKLARGITCLKIAADACYEAIGWQMDYSLIEWVEKGIEKNAHIPEIGWIHKEMVALAREYGMTSSCREGLSVGQLCSKILDDQLILASVSADFKEKRLGGESNPGGHFVIIHGFEWQDHRCAGFYIVDPDKTSQSEQFVSVEAFKDAFSGRAIFVSMKVSMKNVRNDSQQKKTGWVEVNLDAIAHNMKEIRRLTGHNVSIAAVVKSDAYGHGIVKASQTTLEHGASMLAVASLDEAVELRHNDISAPILVLYGVPAWEASRAVDLNLTVAVFDLTLARALSAEAREQDKKVAVHIALDTGMGWFGLSPEEVLDFVLTLRRLPNIEIEGIFSHFANSDAEDHSHTNLQLNRFKACLKELEENGITFPYAHIANSAAILKFPDAYLNMVRPGLILYGLNPSGPHERGVDLKPALEFKTRLIQIRRFSPGEPIGYGCTYVPAGPVCVGILPVGYFDGIPRALSNTGEVLIHGCRARIIGNICMNMCMVDVTDISDVQPGDEVVIIGQQEQESIGTGDVAEKTGTINYEVLTKIGDHIPRIFTLDQQRRRGTI